VSTQFAFEQVVKVRGQRADDREMERLANALDQLLHAVRLLLDVLDIMLKHGNPPK